MLLGLWLASSIAITFIVADSAKTADRILLEHPSGADLRIKAMGQDEARLVLTYPIAQQVRWWLVEWENLELVLGLAFFFFMLFGTREGKLVLGFSLGMYAVVLFQRFFTLPQMVYLGELMDFVAVNVTMPERNQLAAVRNAFIGLEIFQILIGFALGIFLIISSRRSGRSKD